MRMPAPDRASTRVQPQPYGILRRVKQDEKERTIQRFESPYLARFAASGVPMAKGRDLAQTPPGVASEIQGSLSGGRPLPQEVRRFMEPRFRADFAKVRIHADARSERLSSQLNAKAFTIGNHIFFGRGLYQPESNEGLELLAHELTHTIQQGSVIQRSEAPQVTQRSEPMVQRSILDKARDFAADKANFIPGFRMFTIVLGVNPINGQTVERSAANILRAIVELLPGGAAITSILETHGIFDRVGAWLEQQLRVFGNLAADIGKAFKDFVESLGLGDVFDLGGVWDRAKSIFTKPIDRIINFVKGTVTGILGFIKDAVLMPLAKLAQGTRGYDLLRALLGRDPISGEAVPRTADNLIGGFMKLIGEEEIWENIKKGNAINRAWEWFQGALAEVKGIAQAIPGRISNTLSSLTILDFVTVVGVLAKIAGTFGGIATDFFSWGGRQVFKLLEIIVSVVAPNVLQYIAKAKSAFHTILRNPVAFVGNLVRAGRRGFQLFADNILTHLKTALIKWIVGPLAEAGVYIPKSFDLLEVIKLVLSVLGLTWQNIRSKLVKIIPDPVLTALEKTADVLVTLVRDGPAAAWEQIKAELTELKDQLVGQVTDMVSTEVVKAAVTKIATMINPAGAVIQAIVATYKTVTFFIEKIQQIAAVVASFIDSIAAIAAGQVEPAAKKVEQTMANTLVVVLAFLAKLIGLGAVPDKLAAIVKKIRQPIDKGLDKIVAWLGKMLDKLLGKDKGKDNPKLQAGLAALDALNKAYEGKDVDKQKLAADVAGVKAKHPVFKTLVVREDDSGFVYDYTVNPKGKKGGPGSGSAWDVGEYQKLNSKGCDAHHVPNKAYLGFFAERLGQLALKGKKAGALLTRMKKEYDGGGLQLSAILLPKKEHTDVHSLSELKPTGSDRTEFSKELEEKEDFKNDLGADGVVLHSLSGALYVKSNVKQIAGAVDREAGEDKSLKISLSKGKPKPILPEFREACMRIFKGALATGKALLRRLAEKHEGETRQKKQKQIDNLDTLAKETWKPFTENS